jgi:xylulokinase
VHVVDVHGYLVQRLTGQWTTSWATADPLGLVDMASFEWSPELLDLVGLTTEQLPSLVAPGDVIAELGDDVAEELGLKAGTPIVAGAGDGQAAGLGANITEPGKAYLNMGTAVVSGVFSEDYRWDPAYRTLSGPIPRTYDLETVLSSGTYVVSWYVERFEREPDAALGLSAEQILEAAAAQVEPGCEGLVLLPYLNSAQSPYWDADARGAFVGWRGVHGRAHMYRAIMEGIAYALRQQREGVEASMDTPVERYVAMGGGSRSPLWMQMVADVTRRPVTVSRSVETTALGAAVLAAAAVELHGSGDIRAAAEAMSGEGRTYEPEETHQARYDAVYDVYRDLYPALRDLFPRLEAAVRKPSAVGSAA